MNQVTRRTLFNNVQLVDGKSQEARPLTSVLVQGSRIKAVAPTALLGSADADEVIDGNGLTLLPGMIDVHNHSLFPSELPVYLRNGITSMRFSGVQQEDVVTQRRFVESGEYKGPRIHSSGPMLDIDPPQFPKWSQALQSPADARRRVQDMMELEGLKRIDAVIVMHRVSPEVLEAIIEVAHAYGRPVVGQLDRTDAITASKLGMDQLDNTSRISESISFPREALMKYSTPSERIINQLKGWAEVDWEATKPYMDSMLEHGVIYGPTVVVQAHMSGMLRGKLEHDPDFGEYGAAEATAHKDIWAICEGDFTQADRETGKRAVANILEWMYRFHAQGGLLATGTDIQYNGFHFHEELALFSQAGLSNMDVIRCATHNSARALRREDELGVIAPGKAADIILTDGDPTRDLSVLRTPVRTYVNGELVYQR